MSKWTVRIVTLTETTYEYEVAATDEEAATKAAENLYSTVTDGDSITDESVVEYSVTATAGGRR